MSEAGDGTMAERGCGLGPGDGGRVMGTMTRGRGCEGSLEGPWLGLSAGGAVTRVWASAPAVPGLTPGRCARPACHGWGGGEESCQ